MRLRFGLVHINANKSEMHKYAETACHLTYANIQSMTYFRALFGVSANMAFVLWTLMNVPNEGPHGGQCVYLLWILMFLKDYSNGDNLCGRCGVDLNKGWDRSSLITCQTLIW